MDVSLADKVLVITGGSQGLGEATARRGARAGAAGIVITGRDRARGDAVAAAISGAGCATVFVAADLADPAACALPIATCLERFGRVDGLVNAAGNTSRASLVDGTVEQWETIFAVNARAPFLLMQHAVKAMRAAGRGGVIVNILSMNAHCGGAELAIYSGSKGALATLTKNAAHAHRHDRIRVNGINMGWTDTDGERVMQGEILGKGPNWASDAGPKLPFGRIATADEVADLTLFLLSDASGLMTGALIDFDQWVVGAPPAL